MSGISSHSEAAWLGSVFDVVEGPAARPPRLFVYTAELCINRVLENEECLALAIRHERRVERAGRAACLTARVSRWVTRYVSAAMLPTIIRSSDSVTSMAATAKGIDRATTRARRSHEYPG
jgi:hypothetical protein